MPSFIRPLRLPLSLMAAAAFGAGCGPAPETSEPPATEQASALDLLVNAQIESEAASQEWKKVRASLARFHDVNVAIAEGYFNTEQCESNADGQAMGIHFVRFDLFMDNNVNNAYEPEMLLYTRTKEGEYRLVGVEYYQDSVGQPTPSVLGRPLDGPMPGHAPGAPEHYDLHVWLYRENPSGLFAQYNPKLTCY